MSILVTGVAGFIGSAVTSQLLSKGHTVVGIDNLNDYYDVKLKNNRLAQYYSHPKFSFQLMDIVDRKAIKKLFLEHSFDVVIHLAAQPGVRYSLENPAAYIDSNLVGFANVLEACRQYKIQHFIYASSSSVYGANSKLPFIENDPADYPLSLYAATKRANELIAYSYAQQHLPCTGLRFFTVYGPWCRPDMALLTFTRNILEGKTIPVFNNGNMTRDFTYIDDIVEGVIRVIDMPSCSSKSDQLEQPAASYLTPYRIYNIGNSHPVQLKSYIEMLEKVLGKKAKLDMQPMHIADMPNTYADVRAFENVFGKLPHTSLEIGLTRFVKWYKSYYHNPILVDV